ncbi:MAG: leucine-rich repeat domain-containing protein [Planctomycetota bacterium]|jgi:internalin A
METKMKFWVIFAAVVFIVLSMPGLSADSAVEDEDVLSQVASMLSDLAPIEDEGRPDIGSQFKDYIVAMQPGSGDALLEIIKDPEDELSRRATNAFLHAWESMSPEQIDTYFKCAMTAYTKLRPRYPQGTEAYVGAGYTVRYGWGGWPRGRDVKMRTSSYKILDGQFRGLPHGELDGKPFHYEGPMASSGGILVADLGLGAHTVQAVTEYEVTYKDRTYTGTVRSQPATFEIVSPYRAENLAAPHDPELDELVRRAFKPAVSDLEEEYAGPQHTVRRTGSDDEYAIRLPTYKVSEALPVDLCFKVEFHIEETGAVVEGDAIVICKGEKRGGYFSPHHSYDFATLKEGLITFKAVLKPSADLALSYTQVTQYYNGTLTLGPMSAVTYWFKADRAKPWERELKTMFKESKHKDEVDKQVFYRIQQLCSLNPYVRAHGAVGIGQQRDKDITPAIPFLIKLLAGTETELESRAAERAEETLTTIGGPAVRPLIAALKDESPDVRESAAYILGSIADVRAAGPLIEALRDEEPAVRDAAAVGLGQIKDARALEPLTAALSDYDQGVRESAAAALELIKNKLMLSAYRSMSAESRVPAGHFPDSNLEKAIRAAIGKADGEMNGSDLVGVRFIVFDARSSQIEDLRGLEHCTDLIELRLADNRIQDVSPLMGLKNLTDLSLGRNKIADSNLMALAALTNLERLYLDDNQISDMTGLASLRKLSRLQIMNNHLTDISPLSHLSEMTSLWLNGNRIADLSPLAGLTQLEGLSLAGNRISDVGDLAGLKNLAHLDLKGNQLTDLFPLSSLESLTYLYLDKNQITDIGPLSSLTNLTTLELRANRVNDLSGLSNLLKLSSLELRGNQVRDLSALSNLPGLQSLDLSKNPIEDVRPLAGLTNLTRLHIQSAQITDINVLLPLTRLSALRLSGNKISDISVLAGFGDLTYLYLGSNQIRDIGPLSKLAGLKAVWLESNQITDIKPLVDNKALAEGTSVSLSGNPLSEESLNVYIPALKSRGVRVYNAPRFIRTADR